MSSASSKVIPYVEDRRNILVTRLSAAVSPETAVTAAIALERGIEAAFQLEDSELSSEGLPDPDAGAGRCSSRAPKAAPACSAAWSTTPARCPRQPGRRCRSCTSTRTPALTSVPTNPAPAGNAASGPATTACSPTATSACTSLIDRHLSAT